MKATPTLALAAAPACLAVPAGAAAEVVPSFRTGKDKETKEFVRKGARPS
jgi:hypothetical protein